MKITNEVLEAYLHCKTKGHLKLSGEAGLKSDYEAMTDGDRQASREQALARLVACFPGACRGVLATAEMLKEGKPLLADATIEDNALSIRLDALKKADGASKLGEHHYLPVLHVPGNKIGNQQKILLALFGIALAGVQGLRPAIGLVIRGNEGRPGKVRLDTKLYRQAEKVLDEIKRLQTGGEPTKLILNKHCQRCEFRKRCHEQAVKTDDISLLGGVGEKELSRYNRKGIFTLTQLACTFRPRRKGKRAVRQMHHRYHALQALAIRDRRVYVFGTPELPDSSVQIYLDIEGLPDQGFVYLIGMVVVRQDGIEERFSFWADEQEQESVIFEQFLAEVSRYEDFRVFCYSSYERNFLKRLRKAAKEKQPIDRVMERLVNVLSLVHDHLYLPAYSNGLKDVAGCLGYSWTEPNASGLQSLVWRSRWEADHDEKWKQKLLTYNLEDCTALRKVANLIRGLSIPESPPGTSPTIETPGPPVSLVDEIERRDSNRQWGTAQFALPEFEQINRCGYFDYQRDRVYVRASRKIRKKGPRKHRNRKLRVNRRLEVTSDLCPHCGCEQITLVPVDNRTRKLYTKRAFDLAITSGKIQRRVIECHGSLYQCPQCSRQFLPPKYERLEKYFHGLKSWAMYGHVEQRFSLKALSGLLRDSFGLHIASGEIHLFKSQLAHHYQATYQGLLEKILAGGVLHADETEVYLKSGKGYVWVFSGLADVVFMYRPNREGDFLRDLLKDFRGVLVTDFYAAYDSTDCPQQKCLIHLIRDMNQDLLANPYDTELKSLTGPFGVLLREVVATIDNHGLKHRFLKRHEAAVDRYFQFVASHSFRSEAAEALRLRLLKYKEKLFTFIRHDGVSWNNNLAEYAIKRFACYRKDTVGSLKETGIRDYLTLLSICHTCRVRGISFLQFLLSRHLDLDYFSTRKGKRPCAPEIETCPQGLLPTRLAGLGKLRAQTGRIEHAESSEENPT